MEKVHAPDSLKDKVLQAAAREREKAKTPAAGRRQTPRRKGPVLRPVVAACCAAALVLGAVTVGTMTAGNGREGNYLVLAAYAAGKDTDSTPAVAAENANGIKGFNVAGSENITDCPNNRAIQDFQFKLDCVGNHIKELKYEISGTNATFTIAGPAYDKDGKPTDPYKTMPKQKTFTSFTAKPSDDLSSYRIRCVAPLTAEETATLKAEKFGTLYTPEEAKKLKEEANARTNTKITVNDLSFCYTIEDVAINKALSGTIVSITATFDDGTTQTKRYQLSAIKNYLETIVADWQAWQDLDFAYNSVKKVGPDGGIYWVPDPNGMTAQEYGAKMDELLKNEKPLYCITELK